LFDGSERLELVIFHLYVKHGIEMADLIECIIYIKEKMENKNQTIEKIKAELE
jgi:hypothetical protein